MSVQAAQKKATRVSVLRLVSDESLFNHFGHTSIVVWTGDGMARQSLGLSRRQNAKAFDTNCHFFAVLAIAYGLAANSLLIVFAGLFTLVGIVVASEK